MSHLLIVLSISIGAFSTDARVSSTQSSKAGYPSTARGVLEAFVDAFYTGRAIQNLTVVFDTYTEWPAFGPGDSVRIASSRSIRPLRVTRSEAAFEVTFTALGEESEGEVRIDQRKDVQVYRLIKRRGRWKIREPIHIPYVSVQAVIEMLQQMIEWASTSIAKRQFTAVTPEEYYIRIRENAKASLVVMERFQ